MKLIYTISILLCLSIPSTLFAQGSKTPQELASQVKFLIDSKNIDKITELIQPDVDPSSVANFKAMLVTYIGAENLSVYIVPKDDQASVKKFKENNPIPSTFLTIDERVKKYAAVGRIFSLVPLGDLVISGKRVGVSSKGSMSSVVYGKQDGKYLITFAKNKK
jgi:hypothetical protein